MHHPRALLMLCASFACCSPPCCLTPPITALPLIPEHPLTAPCTAQPPPCSPSAQLTTLPSPDTALQPITPPCTPELVSHHPRLRLTSPPGCLALLPTVQPISHSFPPPNVAEKGTAGVFTRKDFAKLAKPSASSWSKWRMQQRAPCTASCSRPDPTHVITACMTTSSPS